jgi:hypothetical protein
MRRMRVTPAPRQWGLFIGVFVVLGRRLRLGETREAAMAAFAKNWRGE